MSVGTLYYARGGCSLASHIVVEETGADYELRELDIRGGQNRSPDYLAINPLGTAPALRIGGETLTETVAILTWLAQNHPDARLLPDRLWEAAQCLSLLAWVSSSVHPARRQSRLPQRYATDPEAHDSIRAMGRERFWAACERVDHLLKDLTWFAGNSYSVCDAYLLVVYGWAAGDGFPVRQLTAFTTLKDRMLERPAVRRTLKREGHHLLLPD